MSAYHPDLALARFLPTPSARATSPASGRAAVICVRSCRTGERHSPFPQPFARVPGGTLGQPIDDGKPCVQQSTVESPDKSATVVIRILRDGIVQDSSLPMDTGKGDTELEASIKTTFE